MYVHNTKVSNTVRIKVISQIEIKNKQTNKQTNNVIIINKNILCLHHCRKPHFILSHMKWFPFHITKLMDTVESGYLGVHGTIIKFRVI